MPIGVARSAILRAVASGRTPYLFKTLTNHAGSSSIAISSRQQQPLHFIRTFSSATESPNPVPNPNPNPNPDPNPNANVANDVAISNYWGISKKTILREDGTVWPWRCFMPWETYTSDTKIDLKKHHAPNSVSDKFAFWTVKALRWPTDLFFQLDSRHGCGEESYSWLIQQ